MIEEKSSLLNVQGFRGEGVEEDSVIALDGGENGRGPYPYVSLELAFAPRAKTQHPHRERFVSREFLELDDQLFAERILQRERKILERQRRIGEASGNFCLRGRENNQHR